MNLYFIGDRRENDKQSTLDPAVRQKVYKLAEEIGKLLNTQDGKGHAAVIDGYGCCHVISDNEGTHALHIYKGEAFLAPATELVPIDAFIPRDTPDEEKKVREAALQYGLLTHGMSDEQIEDLKDVAVGIMQGGQVVMGDEGGEEEPPVSGPRPKKH